MLKRPLSISLRLLVALVVASCGTEQRTPTEPLVGTPPVASAIGEAGHVQEHPGFYFLPPIAPAPESSGVFDGSQRPTVEICAWSGTGCETTVETFTMDSGPGSETIRVDVESELYVVNWHTGDRLRAVPLEPGQRYRIRVFLGARLLGYVDVGIVERRGNPRRVDSEAFVRVKVGRTLPIKFRIEEGFSSYGGRAVSSGYQHTCAVQASGDAYCWGANGEGQLGTGSFEAYASTPQAVGGGHTFASVSAGTFHSCGVTTDGDAYCWGQNLYGELGIGARTPTRSPTPLPVTGGHRFVAVTAGYQTTCGVTTEGQGLCWGYNGYGNLGTGSLAYAASATPLAIAGGHTFRTIDLVNSHACGVTTAGEGYCWGYDYWGTVGQGTTYPNDGIVRRPDPTPIASLRFRSLDAGYLSSCGVTRDAGAYCWGFNFYGELGIGTVNQTYPDYAVPTPTAVIGGLDFASISTGGNRACGIQSDGTGHCWGNNRYGGVGNGLLGGYVTAPESIAGDHVFAELTVGFGSACGVTDEGVVVCWGRNSHGQIGDGTTTDAPVPVPVLDLDPPG